MFWLRLYRMDTASEAQRQAFFGKLPTATARGTTDTLSHPPMWKNL